MLLQLESPNATGKQPEWLQYKEIASVYRHSLGPRRTARGDSRHLQKHEGQHQWSTEPSLLRKFITNDSLPVKRFNKELGVQAAKTIVFHHSTQERIAAF